MSTTLLVGVSSANGIRLNTSPSLPLGLYRTSHEEIKHGVLVTVCLPSSIAAFGRERGYFRPGSCPSGVMPLLKRVGAVAGDVVELSPHGVRINGQALPNSAIASVDSRGRPLPHPSWGRHLVAAHEVWLFATTHPNSFDSRYFGPIHRDAILNSAQPLLTLTGGRP